VRTVLVTGATGALGNVIAKCLLDERDTRIRLLVRARSRAHLDERLQELFRFWGIHHEGRDLSDRIQAVSGDVMLPDLGLETSVHAHLTGEVTHVIHSAGNVKLNRPLDEARRSAVDSAAHIVSFVRACAAHGQLRKLDFVSTVGVAGRMAGLVPERAFHEPRAFRNSYEAAKAEAEALVLEAMSKGLPATIHRPSMIVGESTDGTIIQFQVFYYLCELLSGQLTAGIIPNVRDVQLDIVPVDYVARAIQVSSACDEAAGRIFHLCSGPLRAPRVTDLAHRIREFFHAQGRHVPALRTVSPAIVRMLLPVMGTLMPGRIRRSLAGLPYFLAYLEPPQTFDNVGSDAFFSSAGVSIPPVAAYLDKVLMYYHRSREAARARSSADRAARAVA
jgi:thioester reductase-like protein